MPDPATARPFFPRRRRTLGLAAAAMLGVGAIAGAAVVAETRPSVTMAPVTPVAIRALSTGGVITIRGTVAEIYGNKFVMTDASGRMLVDTGPEGDGRTLVTAGEPVTVQGRFDRGFVHAAFLVGPDNKALALGPHAGPPPHRPGGPGERPGPDGPPPPPRADRTGDAPPPPLNSPAPTGSATTGA